MEKVGIDIPDIHIGELILKYLRDNNISQGYLAKQIDMPTSNLSRLLKRKSMETQKLFLISFALDHNFFEAFIMPDDIDENDNRPMGVPELGALIEKRMKEINMNQTEFAAKLNTTQSDVSRILKRQSIDTDKLARISRVLGYNFFRDFYKDSNVVDFETGVPFDFLKRYEELVIENENLRKKLKDAEAEIDRLKQILKK